MNITKENYNEYVSAALELTVNDIYEEAADIAFSLIEYWDKVCERGEDCDELDVSIALRVLTFTQWRSMDAEDEYALLAEILANNNYWSEEFINQNRNSSGAWVSREKGLAYDMLARKWAKNKLKAVFHEYSESCMQKAIEILDEEITESNDSASIELLNDCKIDLAMIRNGFDTIEARRMSITLMGENLTESQRGRVMEIYNKSTDEIFDDNFCMKAIRVLYSDDIKDDEVREDIVEKLLESYSLPDNDDPFWWMFTHMMIPDERRKIRFVANIEDAAGNDFNEIPWVFTLDRYPFDIKFKKGISPAEDSVYELVKDNPVLYKRIS